MTFKDLHMADTWKTQTIKRRGDGSFVIVVDGIGYHVPDNEEYHDRYLEVQQHITETGIVPEHDDGILHIGPARTLAEQVRDLRDSKLRHECDGVSPMRWAMMSASEQQQAAAYRQALLDLPQQEGFPWDGVNIPFPEKPACLN